MKNRKCILVVFAVLALLCLGIGYAALSDTLNLGGSISANGTDDSTSTGDQANEYLYLSWAEEMPSGDSLPFDCWVSEGTTGSIYISPIFSDSHQQGDVIGFYLDAEGFSKKGESGTVQTAIAISMGINSTANLTSSYTLTDRNGNEITEDLMTIEVSFKKLEDIHGNKYNDQNKHESLEGLVDGDHMLLIITVTNQKTLLHAEDSYDYNVEVYITATATNE